MSGPRQLSHFVSPNFAMTSTHPHSTRPHATDAPGRPQGCTQGPSQGTFESTRSLKLFYQSWYPSPAQSNPLSGDLTTQKRGPAEIKGVVALVHGLGEHSGRYCKVVKALTSAGPRFWVVRSPDRGLDCAGL
ncbi:MAG: alpha/beta hydrolase, partial [Cyanobacteria bacterium J06598_3]